MTIPCPMASVYQCYISRNAFASISIRTFATSFIHLEHDMEFLNKTSGRVWRVLQFSVVFVGRHVRSNMVKN